MLELYTDRLRLRSLRADDWDNFLMLHQDPIVNQFVRRPIGESVIREKFEQKLAPWQYGTGDWLTLVIEELGTDKFIGYSGLCCASHEFGHAEVGYMLANEGQGQGYATEGLKAVIDWACLNFKVHKFIGMCAKQNIASIRVLEKNGFQREGVLRDNYKIDDTWIDEFTYGLLSHERGE